MIYDPVVIFRLKKSLLKNSSVSKIEKSLSNRHSLEYDVFPYKMLQLPPKQPPFGEPDFFSLAAAFFSFSLRCLRPKTIASSKTSFRFFCVTAELSIYVSQPKLEANFLASDSETGCSLCCANSTRVFTSVLRSDWVPTRITGTCFDDFEAVRSSGIHFSRTLWKEEGLTTEKQSRKTSVSG